MKILKLSELDPSKKYYYHQTKDGEIVATLEMVNPKKYPDLQMTNFPSSDLIISLTTNED